jgi:hypothetical protein
VTEPTGAHKRCCAATEHIHRRVFNPCQNQGRGKPLNYLLACPASGSSMPNQNGRSENGSTIRMPRGTARRWVNGWGMTGDRADRANANRVFKRPLCARFLERHCLAKSPARRRRDRAWSSLRVGSIAQIPGDQNQDAPLLVLLVTLPTNVTPTWGRRRPSS